jgi:hypothetical protein
MMTPTRIQKRVDEFEASIPDGERESIGLRVIVEEGASRAEIKAAQKAAIAERLAAHSEDHGRPIDPWIIRTLHDPDPDRIAAVQAAASPVSYPAAADYPPPAPRADPDDFYGGAARNLP